MLIKLTTSILFIWCGTYFGAFCSEYLMETKVIRNKNIIPVEANPCKKSTSRAKRSKNSDYPYSYSNRYEGMVFNHVMFPDQNTTSRKPKIKRGPIKRLFDKSETIADSSLRNFLKYFASLESSFGQKYSPSNYSSLSSYINSIKGMNIANQSLSQKDSINKTRYSDDYIEDEDAILASGGPSLGGREIIHLLSHRHDDDRIKLPYMRGTDNMIANNQHFQKLSLPPLMEHQPRQSPVTGSSSNKRMRIIDRPEPSGYLLPVTDLQENPDPQYDPSGADISYRKLKNLLGRKYDPRYMSATRPWDSVVHPNGTLYFGFRQDERGLPIGRVSMYKIMNMNFKMAGTRRKIRLRVSRKIKRKVFRYLKAYTACPVLYKWKHIGIRFWPSWVLEGNCYGTSGSSSEGSSSEEGNGGGDLNGSDQNSNGIDDDREIRNDRNRQYDSHRSCSIPPGMTCRPSTSINLTLLRWYCQSLDNYCSWIFVQYPIIETCKCSP